MPCLHCAWLVRTTDGEGIVDTCSELSLGVGWTWALLTSAVSIHLARFLRVTYRYRFMCCEIASWVRGRGGERKFG
jgi:hypothetical protein